MFLRRNGKQYQRSCSLTQQRTVVHTSDLPDPQDVEELADTLSGDEEVQSDLFRRRDHGWEERGLGRTKLPLHNALTQGKRTRSVQDEITVNIVGNFFVVVDDRRSKNFWTKVMQKSATHVYMHTIRCQMLRCVVSLYVGLVWKVIYLCTTLSRQFSDVL